MRSDFLMFVSLEQVNLLKLFCKYNNITLILIHVNAIKQFKIEFLRRQELNIFSS